MQQHGLMHSTNLSGWWCLVWRGLVWVKARLLHPFAEQSPCSRVHHTMYIALCFYITIYSYCYCYYHVTLLLLYSQSLQPPSTITFLLTLHLCTNRDSSICTTTPFPPSIVGPSFNSQVEQTSLQNWYTSAVTSDTSAWSAAVHTPTSMLHR